MKKLSLYVILILFKVFLSSFVFASNLNPEKILNRVDDVYRSNASYGILTLICDNNELAKNSYVRAMVQRKR